MAQVQSAYRDPMHMFGEFDQSYRDYDYFSDQSSPMSSTMSPQQSPIPSPSVDDPNHFHPLSTAVDQCSGSYENFVSDNSLVYTTLAPVDSSGLRFDEMNTNVSESSPRQQCDVQVFRIATEIIACLGGFRYPIDPNETFDPHHSFQAQAKSIPVTATEKTFTSSPVYTPPPRRQTTHTGSGRNRKLPRAERLWEFILRLLMDPNYNPSHIEWVDRERGMFRLVNSRQIARMWGKRKNNHDMTYEKLSRAMRYYYHRKILQPVFGKKLVYKFGPNSTGWQLTAPCG